MSHLVEKLKTTYAINKFLINIEGNPAEVDHESNKHRSRKQLKF